MLLTNGNCASHGKEVRRIENESPCINGKWLYTRITIRKKPKKTKQYHIKVRNIVIGVPITFLDKYCPEQFCIIGHEHDLEGTGESEGAVGGQLMVQKKGMYKRILIRKKSK